ncbi:UNVERIFIED_ORG: hypothetical protein LHK14_21540 (plasmid) [Roseateles sp. XES5]|nr:hypothetical protein [Roseateles sp. XES5]
MKMHLQQRRNGWVAFAVAALMALQAFLSPLAQASVIGSSPIDAYGNPLCITHLDEQKQASTPDKERPSAPNCCTLACGMAAGLVPPFRPVLILFNPLAQPSQRIFDSYEDPARSVREALPGHPRGPPTFA